MATFRKSLFLLLSVALVFALAACSGKKGGTEANDNSPQSTQGAAQTDAPKEKIELTFWTLGNNGYETLVDKWNADHPDIQVKVQNTGDQTAHHNNMLTAISAGSGAPDIFMLEIGFMEKFLAATDNFYNLNDLGAQDLKGNYLDWKWQQASSKDGSFQLGLPTDIGPTVLYYRQDLVQAAGLPADPAGLAAALDTWDKFAAAAKQYHEKTGKYFVDTTDLLHNALRDQSDGEIYLSKADGSFIGDTNPQVKKAFDYTVKAIQEGWVNPSPMWSPEWGQATNNGDFAVMPAPAWMSGVIKGNAPDTAGKWRITQLPEGAGNWGGSFLTIPKQSKHPKEAFAFISWMVSKENQMESFKTNQLFPSIPAIYDEQEFKDFVDPSGFYGDQKIAQEFAAAAQKVKPMYYGPQHDAIDAIFKNALRNVLEKKAEPAKEWDEAVKQAKEIVKRGG
ncbi:MAG TPA: extracellular solute-binding protein [Bacilli bacterium]